VGKSDALTYVLFRVRQVALWTPPCFSWRDRHRKGVIAASFTSTALAARKHCHDQLRCAAANLIESELFGREKGAFTGSTERQMGRFELADGGTIFLDEIGEMRLNCRQSS